MYFLASEASLNFIKTPSFSTVIFVREIVFWKKRFDLSVVTLAPAIEIWAKTFVENSADVKTRKNKITLVLFFIIFVEPSII